MLERLGIPLVVAASQADETVHSGERPGEYLARVVEEKLSRARRSSFDPSTPLVQRAAAVLVADTIVVVDERILGKPSDDTESAEMLSSLAGRSHHVMSRYAIGYGDRAGAPLAHKLDRTVVTTVTMRALNREEVTRYVRTGEGRDKAGAYAIQGLASYFVTEISGSYTNVVGLPLSHVIEDLQRSGCLGPLPVTPIRDAP